MSSKKILIVGGYGVVGRRITAQFAAEYPGCLVIGGRNAERADELAKSIGQGIRGRRIDITAPATIASALDDIAVVISCIDLSDGQHASRKLFLGASSQFVIQSFDRSVAFAGTRLEARAIQNSNSTTTVSDEAPLLKCLCEQRHACSSDAEHFAQELLRQLQLFSAGAIRALQQPPRQSRYALMNSIAGTNLLRFGPQRFNVLLHESLGFLASRDCPP